MKKFFEIMAKDIQKDDFTDREYVIYGVVVPVVFVIAVFAVQAIMALI